MASNVAALTGISTAGAGGAGATVGGAGGALNSVTLEAGDTITLQSGNGGAGGNGAAGAGGDVTGSGANSLVGSILLTAGNAGLTGAAPGLGGSITGFGSSAGSAAAGTAGHNISYRAGDGHAGGAGGDIANSATSTNALNSLPNTGNVTIRAGDGSAANGTAGAGGNITVFDGSVGLNGLTSITAGNGGGAAGDTKVGGGGTVSQIHLTGANNEAAVATAQRITIDAGNAGVSSAAKNGAGGGDVQNVVIYNLDAGTVLHHVAAGDGSNGTKHGGVGGSINVVNVGVPTDAVADIGIRSGVAFGYAANEAGGLFAGVGGTGSKTPAATNGSISNITAKAISGIQAGKAARPQLVASVDHVILEGLVPTRANADGSFANFDTANLVGSVVNPIAAKASTYKAGDGLIASQTLPTNTNFTAEALLTLDGNGNREFSDYQQPNPAPVTIVPVPTNLA